MKTKSPVTWELAGNLGTDLSVTGWSCREIIIQIQNSPTDRYSKCFPFDLVNIWPHSSPSYDLCFITFLEKSTIDNFINTAKR